MGGIKNYYHDTLTQELAPEQYDQPQPDLVNHPSHYTFGKYEVLPVLLDWFKDDPLGWQVGKYLARYKHKGNPIQDLKKARFYLEALIQELEDAPDSQ
jgi:hypothetical protein